MIVDMHIHLADYRIYPEYWLEGIRNNVIQAMKAENGIEVPVALLNNIVKSALKDFDGSKLIAQMDDAGIDKSVVLLADLGYNKEDIKLSIEELFHLHYEFLSRYPDRLIVFGGIDPRRGREGVDLFEKGIKEYGFKGLKLYPPCGFELNDQELYPFYEICDHYKLPVLAHIGASLPTMKSTFRYPASVLEATKEFKNIPFILGHAALLHFEDSYKLPLERETIYLEISGFQQILDDKAQLIERVKKLFEICPEKILFGTDWPLFNSKGSQKLWVNFFKELDTITSEQKEMLFYRNAFTIFSKNTRNEG